MFLGLETSQTDEEQAGPENEILSNAQMAAADKLAVRHGAQSYNLMLAAGQSVANTVHQHFPDYSVLILCGPGNNGGDGYVAAHFLQETGVYVTVMSLVPPRKLKGDAKKAYKDWKGKAQDFKTMPEMPAKTVVVDAVFGTGFSRALEEPVASVLRAIKDAGWPVVAVDIPSGVNGDTGEADPQTMEAAHTVTFFRKKAGHALMPGMSLCGDITVHDIGIGEEVLEETGCVMVENSPVLWHEKLPKQGKASHKYSKGHLVILGGETMTGAARMASEAAMRTGAGLCTIVAAKAGAHIYREAAAHVMVEDIEGFADFASHVEDKRRNAIVMGPGAGLKDVKGLQGAVLDALGTRKPMVLDADGISCFEDSPETLFEALHGKCVLTPHEGEFIRLFPDLMEGSKLERVNKAAERCGAILLLKGPDTLIAGPDHKTVVNIHSSAALATAGSGDVLAGIIGALMAQSMEPFDAACAAAWIHGDIGTKGGAGMVAPDIIAGIPAVLRDFA